mmetsp:Transcript_12538/g.34789  ORF Transcript_12538/g.34789 Transcript_12538/m.34789 type:complete len:263 (-) Transcript_12538:80-868(-)|eukprot:CAMPEP_0168748888 /NCGR_PEP_ID=MMETSP0724-20121128/16414_1 /TAXON_ID=265536 /ORGANISM="Amphiprora sp., Strain CCMP467" /LENGTH=262 /DNA_ID=CAMNT_0008796743 /DNA_START=204 /DNA_END=992 /DNA_ORIENTATION=+
MASLAIFRGSLKKCTSSSHASIVARSSSAGLSVGPISSTQQQQQHRCLSSGEKDAAATAKKAASFKWNSKLDDLFDPTNTCPVFGKGPRVSLYHSPKMLECGVREDNLKYRTTCYGKGLHPPYIHLNEHRVAVHVELRLLPLEKLGHEILRQVVGEQRYNLTRNELILQCNQFPSRIENKRYLVQTLNKLILSCQRLEQEAHNPGEDVRTEIPHISDSLETTGGGPKDALLSNNPGRVGFVVNRKPKPSPATWDQLGLDEYL